MGDVLPCPERIVIGPFEFECTGHERWQVTPRSWARRPYRPYLWHHADAPRTPGEPAVSWYTKPSDEWLRENFGAAG